MSNQEIHAEEEVEEERQTNPIFEALSEESKAEIAEFVDSVQNAQNAYDAAVVDSLGGMAFYTTGILIQQQILIRSLQERVSLLEGR